MVLKHKINVFMIIDITTYRGYEGYGYALIRISQYSYLVIFKDFLIDFGLPQYKHQQQYLTLLLLPQKTRMENNWMPLESNPEVINKYAQKLGFNTDVYAVQELLSIEDWAQEMISKPVFGVILLYQQTPGQLSFFETEKLTLNAANNSPKLFYMKQYAHNACGTIALFHCILNAVQQYPDVILPDSALDKFQKKNTGKNPEDVGHDFKGNNQLKETHYQSAVNEGQSACSGEVESHFIAFVEKDGHLYEMDGGKKMPVNLGPCTKESLLERACEAVKGYMARDPDNINFNVMALGKKPAEQ